MCVVVKSRRTESGNDVWGRRIKAVTPLRLWERCHRDVALLRTPPRTPPPPSVLFPGFKSGTEIKGKEFTWTHIPQIPGTCHITWRLEASEDVAGMTHHGVLRSEGHQKIAARESREFQTGYITFTGTGDTTSSSRSTYLAIPGGKSRLKGTFIKYQKWVSVKVRPL